MPYAFGALYNHPMEGFALDTVGAGLAYKLSLMTPRMGMYFFVFSTIKTVDDHCGYALPWDPLQRITSNNAAYHDIHHQSWGIKSNFSQPFFTFWDRLLGTMWQGDTTLRYARDRNTAARKAAAAAAATAKAAAGGETEETSASAPEASEAHKATKTANGSASKAPRATRRTKAAKAQ